MAKKSLPDVSVKFIAEVEAMIRNLKRAENATKSSTAAMDKEVDKFTKDIKRKFSGADIGKSILTGLGVGSGFAVAQTAANAVAGYYREAAESAKRIADLSDQSYEVFKKTMALRKTDEQVHTEDLKEQARILKEMADLQQPKYRTVTMGGPFMTSSKEVLVGISDEEKEKLAKLELDLKNVTYAVERYKAQISEPVKISNALTDFFGTLDEQSTEAAKRTKEDFDEIKAAVKAFADGPLKQQLEAEYKLRAAKQKANAETFKTAEAYRDLADPMRTYQQQLGEVNKLQATGALKADEAAAAIASITDAMQDMQSRRVDDALKDFFGDMDDESKSRIEGFKKVETAAKHLNDELNQMWNSVSDRAGQAFADMVLSGEAAFGDLVDLVARAVIEMVARLAIINPILNMLFGGMAGFGMLPAFFGAGAAAAGAGAAGAGAIAGARAEGGPVDFGSSYLVGEKGPEIFTPRQSGTIIPNSSLRTSGGNTYVIDARGADVGAVDRLERALLALAGPGVVERRALSVNTDMRRRGGAAYA